MRQPIVAMLVLLAWSAIARGGAIIVNLPDTATPEKAVAIDPQAKIETAGKIDGRRVQFDGILPGAAYDLRISLAGGAVLQGVNLNWYSLEPPAENAGELTVDDWEEIRAIVQDVRGFFNRNEILLVNGNHDRATLLVQLIRDNKFHSDKGGEIVWHTELWYFKFQNGGWEKIQQQNRVLRRERFRNRQEFDAEAGRIRWLEQLGGIMLAKKDESKEITLPSSALSGPAKNTPAR
jgi:hypothetical protein